MLSKKIRSAIAVVMAGTIVAAMPAVSAVTPCLENRLSITASAVSEGYYNMLSSVSVPDGEYVFYHPYSKAVMTDQFNADSGKILSEQTSGLEYSVNGSAIPAKYRYQIKSAGNGSYYIINHEGKYLDIVKYNTLGFTSTPTAYHLYI